MNLPLMVGGGIVGALALFWLFATFKRSRPDGTLARVHPYRRMMPMIMPTRNESVVYFDYTIDADPLLDYIEAHRERLGCNVSHLLVAACAMGLHRHPRLNRFVVGKRVYDRDGVWISFSMKRKKLDAAAKIATVKIDVPAQMSLAALCETVNARISHERSDDETYLDRELSLFFKLPHPLLAAATRLMFWANAHNLLPGQFIEDDGLFASIFVANLGSLGMAPGYHHLYEWGTIPLFMMAGAVEERPVVGEDGAVSVQRVMPLRFTFDERVNDGLSAGRALSELTRMLEDPVAHFGAQAERPLGAAD